MTTSAPTPKRKPIQNVALVLVLAVVVIIGAVIYFMSKRTGPATDQANAFIQDLIAGNLDSAKSRCAPNIDFDEMARLADRKTGKMRFWGKLIDQSLVEKTQGDRADVDGSLTFEQLSKTFSATLKKQPDGKYLITSYNFS